MGGGGGDGRRREGELGVGRYTIGQGSSRGRGRGSTGRRSGQGSSWGRSGGGKGPPPLPGRKLVVVLDRWLTPPAKLRQAFGLGAHRARERGAGQKSQLRAGDHLGGLARWALRMGMRAFHTSEKVGPRTRQRREEEWTGLFAGARTRQRREEKWTGLFAGARVWWMGRRVREAGLTWRRGVIGCRGGEVRHDSEAQ
jgi:hypothetical protein